MVDSKIKLRTVIVAEVVGGGKVHCNLGSAADGLVKHLKAKAWCLSFLKRNQVPELLWCFSVTKYNLSSKEIFMILFLVIIKMNVRNFSSLPLKNLGQKII